MPIVDADAADQAAESVNLFGDSEDDRDDGHRHLRDELFSPSYDGEEYEDLDPPPLHPDRMDLGSIEDDKDSDKDYP